MAKPETITSAANPLLKEVRRAIARGGLTASGWWVAETFHLLDEALRSQCKVQSVLCAESAAVEARRLAGRGVTVLPDSLFRTISGVETSQGVIALVQPPRWTPADLFGARSLVVVLDGLQDPGNAGTIARAAEAFGATGIFFMKGGVSAYHPKTLRASAGSLFRLPFVQAVEADAVLATIADAGVELFAGVPAAAGVPGIPDLTGACGLIIGNEAHGVSPDFRAAAEPISIPTVGVESLNAAMAAAILLYEARRQRMLPQ